MHERPVTSVDRNPDGSITALHGPWGKATANLAVLLIGSGSCAFYVDTGDGRGRAYAAVAYGSAGMSLSVPAEPPAPPR